MSKPQPINRQMVLDAPVDPVDLDTAVSIMNRWLDAQPVRLHHIVTVNPEFVIAARRNPEFSRVLREADLATADGVGIILAGKLLGIPAGQRITGVDLTEAIAALPHPNARVFLLGAAEGVAARTATMLRQRYPAFQVTGTFSGDASDAGWPAIAAELDQAQPTILLVAFGHPRQDLWINHYKEELERRGILVAVGVGGAFDYLSGLIPRAPQLVRRLGFEWLYRLIRQPWRWRRQLALPLFAALLARERLKRL